MAELVQGAAHDRNLGVMEGDTVNDALARQSGGGPWGSRPGCPLTVCEVQMAVRLDVEPMGLRVQFSGVDLVAACSRGLFVPFTRILGARVMTRSDALASSPRLPCPGFWWPRRYRAGCWGVGERRQLWSARQSAHVLVVYLTGRPFHRVVVEVGEPERAHRRVDAALLHSKKTSARRSIRDHSRITTDQPVLDPAHAQKRQQRRRPPRHNVDQVVPAPSSALISVDAESLAVGGDGPSRARMRSGEAVSHLGSPAQDDRNRGRLAMGDHDLQVDELSPPMEIEPSGAARLCLYDHRVHELGRHSGGPEPASTRLDSNSCH
jgi:hypothetical protein